MHSDMIRKLDGKLLPADAICLQGMERELRTTLPKSGILIVVSTLLSNKDKIVGGGSCPALRSLKAVWTRSMSVTCATCDILQDPVSVALKRAQTAIRQSLRREYYRDSRRRFLSYLME